MKQIITLILILGTAALAACGEGQSQDPNVDGLLAGNDRDIHGCIGSAGYLWSEVSQGCVRLWEVGAPLIDVQDQTATSKAYIVVGKSKDAVEVFLPDGQRFTMKGSEADGWTSKISPYTVKFGTLSGYGVYDEDGQALYVQTVPEYDEGDHEDTIREYGLITSIEDGAYPMYTLNVEFPERQFKAGFSLNIENINLDPAQLAALDGKYVTLNYTSGIEASLLEMTLDGAFLLGSTEADVEPDWKTVTGILSGADSETESDLPGEVFVKTTGGPLRFEYYITPEMVTANGKEVVAYFYERVENRIVELEAATE